MVEISDDELLSTIKSGQEIKEKINKKQDLEEYIEFQRKRKFNEEALRLKREALLRKKRNRNFNTDNSMDEGTADTSYRTTRGQEIKTINVAKLPKLIKDGYEVFIPTEYTRINKA